mmetsp:Transcript_11874/g.19122  ORF Transcript_11874/g.19122 Transcript_11874/m.19122 type:complete len:209 (+) Transcript_11874:390-1016(+)
MLRTKQGCRRVAKPRNVDQPAAMLCIQRVCSASIRKMMCMKCRTLWWLPMAGHIKMWLEIRSRSASSTEVRLPLIPSLDSPAIATADNWCSRCISRPIPTSCCSSKSPMRTGADLTMCSRKWTGGSPLKLSQLNRLMKKWKRGKLSSLLAPSSNARLGINICGCEISTRLAAFSSLSTPESITSRSPWTPKRTFPSAYSPPFDALLVT